MYLDGENISPRSPAEAKALIGKTVKYLQIQDIDKSGRGYFFPQQGKIVAVHGREIAIDDPNNFQIHLSHLQEMVEIESEESAQ